MIPEVVELLSMWEQGAFARPEVLARLFALADPHGVDRVLSELPAPWRDDLVSWMRATFDNQVPVDEFVWLGNNPEPPGRRQLILLAREWLARNPG